jgi:hypothetical protein
LVCRVWGCCAENARGDILVSENRALNSAARCATFAAARFGGVSLGIRKGSAWKPRRLNVTLAAGCECLSTCGRRTDRPPIRKHRRTHARMTPWTLRGGARVRARVLWGLARRLWPENSRRSEQSTQSTHWTDLGWGVGVRTAGQTDNTKTAWQLAACPAKVGTRD